MNYDVNLIATVIRTIPKKHLLFVMMFIRL